MLIFPIFFSFQQIFRKWFNSFFLFTVLFTIILLISFSRSLSDIVFLAVGMVFSFYKLLFVSIFSSLNILEIPLVCCLKIFYYLLFHHIDTAYKPPFVFWYLKTGMLFTLLQYLTTKLRKIWSFSFYSNTFLYYQH